MKAKELIELITGLPDWENKDVFVGLPSCEDDSLECSDVSRLSKLEDNGIIIVGK